MPWKPELSVGIEMIDEQHQVWFEKAEKLFEEGKKGKAKEYIGELLDFLEDYTKKHFADEEAYMKKISYPQYDIQKEAHTNFIAKLEKIKEDFNSSGGNIAVIIAANKMVIDWLTNHISKMDKQIAEFVKNK